MKNSKRFRFASNLKELGVSECLPSYFSFSSVLRIPFENEPKAKFFSDQQNFANAFETLANSTELYQGTHRLRVKQPRTDGKRILVSLSFITKTPQYNLSLMSETSRLLLIRRLIGTELYHQVYCNESV